jgi:hypothetical protein
MADRVFRSKSGFGLYQQRVIATSILRSERSPHERRKSEVSDLRKLTMAELGNTRVLWKCGTSLVLTNPDYASLHPGYACYAY